MRIAVVSDVHSNLAALEAVLEELDGLAEVRAAVHPGQETLDQVLGAEIEPGDPLDRLRKQKSLGIVHRGSVRLRGWG